MPAPGIEHALVAQMRARDLASLAERQQSAGRVCMEHARQQDVALEAVLYRDPTVQGSGSGSAGSG